jgi:SAM-dependent methyltransferase
MAHPQQQQFITEVKRRFPDFFTGKTVLEVGSLDINGSVRSFFQQGSYTGIDVGPGKGVDFVCAGQDYEAPDASFDVVISCECMEHNPYWAATWSNMIRMCKPGGIIIMTCATTGRPEHGTTRTRPKDSPLTVAKGWDYYKNLTEEDFRAVVHPGSVFSTFEFSVESRAHDLYFWGIRS